METVLHLLHSLEQLHCLLTGCSPFALSITTFFPTYNLQHETAATTSYFYIYILITLQAQFSRNVWMIVIRTWHKRCICVTDAHIYILISLDCIINIGFACYNGGWISYLSRFWSWPCLSTCLAFYIPVRHACIFAHFAVKTVTLRINSAQDVIRARCVYMKRL